MNNDAFFGVLKSFLQIGFFIGGTGLVLALTQPRGSNEFVVSMCSGLIGLALIVSVVVMLRWMGSRIEQDEEDEGPPI